MRGASGFLARYRGPIVDRWKLSVTNAAPTGCIFNIEMPGGRPR
jgi:hypothetical protein